VGPAPRWEVVDLSGTVRELHERSIGLLAAHEAGGRSGRAVVVHHPVDRALVLGSAQKDDVVDMEACKAAGVDVVRRRSGGGAVLVDPDHIVWIDLFVPAGDPLWQHDVGRAAWWVGEAWAAALRPDLPSVSVWKGPMQRRLWSSLICFAGLGPGEVTLGAGPETPKVVGISQRRTRAGALFQCACIREWDPALLVWLLALSSEDRHLCEKALHTAAIGPDPELTEVTKRLFGALP